MNTTIVVVDTCNIMNSSSFMHIINTVHFAHASTWHLFLYLLCNEYARSMQKYQELHYNADQVGGAYNQPEGHVASCSCYNSDQSSCSSCQKAPHHGCLLEHWLLSHSVGVVFVIGRVCVMGETLPCFGGDYFSEHHLVGMDSESTRRYGRWEEEGHHHFLQLDHSGLDRVMLQNELSQLNAQDYFHHYLTSSG